MGRGCTQWIGHMVLEFIGTKGRGQPKTSSKSHKRRSATNLESPVRHGNALVHLRLLRGTEMRNAQGFLCIATSFTCFFSAGEGTTGLLDNFCGIPVRILGDALFGALLGGALFGEALFGDALFGDFVGRLVTFFCGIPLQVRTILGQKKKN